MKYLQLWTSFLKREEKKCIQICFVKQVCIPYGVLKYEASRISQGKS